jgi:hypothetical protein
MADAAGLDADANEAGAGIGEFFFDELERTAGGGDLHGTAFYWWHGTVFSCALDGAAMGKLQKSWLKLVESAGRDLYAGSCAVELAPIVFTNSAGFHSSKKDLFAMRENSRFAVRSGFAVGFLTLCLLFASPVLKAQTSNAAHQQVEKLVEASSANWKQVSKQIWDFAELGYHENKSSALLQAQLKAAGFAVQSGVADEPTAFIASYGEGKPVIAILGEFDALP